MCVRVQQIEAEEAAIWEETLAAAGAVEAEARQRFQKSREAKQVQTENHHAPVQDAHGTRHTHLFLRHDLLHFLVTGMSILQCWQHQSITADLVLCASNWPLFDLSVRSNNTEYM